MLLLSSFGMARRGFELRLLAAAVALVVVVALGLVAFFMQYLVHHPSAHRPGVDASPTDAAPLELPETIGPRCGQSVVAMVRGHESTEPGVSIEELARRRLEEKAAQEGVHLVIHGWRGLEDRERSQYCRISFRYQLAAERGAEVWLVDPEAPPHARLEPQGLLSVESTRNLPWPDGAAESSFQKKCADDGIERVKQHFSYKEDYTLWRCLRKRAVEIRKEGGPEIVYGAWKSRVEGPDRCLVWVEFLEDGVEQKAYFRLRYVKGEEHALEPLTPRAIEVIYGPGVFSR